jgi:hypothetical protein
MMEHKIFKYKIFSFGCYKDLFWFRIFGYGLSFAKGDLSFSEKHGYSKYLKIRNIRISFL